MFFVSTSVIDYYDFLSVSNTRKCFFFMKIVFLVDQKSSDQSEETMPRPQGALILILNEIVVSFFLYLLFNGHIHWI